MAESEDVKYGWELYSGGEAPRCKCVCILAKVQISFWPLVSTTTIKISMFKKTKGKLKNEKVLAHCKQSALHSSRCVSWRMAYCGDLESAFLVSNKRRFYSEIGLSWHVGGYRHVAGSIKWRRQLGGKEPRGGVHPWTFLRGRCVVRGQQLEIWFGQLDPLVVQRKGNMGPGFLEKVLVGFLEVD